MRPEVGSLPLVLATCRRAGLYRGLITSYNDFGIAVYGKDETVPNVMWLLTSTAGFWL